MAELFLNLLNMSIAASWLVLAVIILRFLLKKVPKGIICVLWALVAVRLICPISFESYFSLVPSVETVPPEIQYVKSPQVDTGIQSVDGVINPIIQENFTPKLLTDETNSTSGIATALVKRYSNKQDAASPYETYIYSFEKKDKDAFIITNIEEYIN